MDRFLEQTAAHQDPRRPPYVINWSVLHQGNPPFVMADPFRTYVQESRDYCAEGSSHQIPETLSKEEGEGVQ